MQLETHGHACMLLRDDDGSPLMLTDPWLLGSTYWRSWWLQNYPSPAQMADFSKVKYAYITHEHMDHFHPPTIRKIGTGPTYLSPALPQEQISVFLQEKGFNAKVLEPLQWHKLNEKLSILSIPLPNDDSVLLAHTPTAFIVNLNDSKPAGYQLKRVRKYIDEHVRGKKKVIVLSSYSPASIVNSFRNGGSNEIISLKDKKAYVDYICGVMDELESDYFIPFASQVIFYRSDSKWANAYKVTFADLEKHWKAKTAQLCHPYSTIDLESFEVSYVAESDYYRDEETIKTKVEKQETLEEGVEFTEEDWKGLRKKLSFSWFWLPLLFRRGIGFYVDGQERTYKPWGKRMEKGIDKPSFALMVPPQALKDVLFTGHFADLGITMFTLIILNGRAKPKMVYVFFLLVALHDYKHLWSLGNFWKWFKTSFRLNKWKIPRLSAGS